MINFTKRKCTYLIHLFFSLSFVFLIPLKIFADEYAFTGEHFIASYLECDEKNLLDIKNLSSTMIEAAKASGATILGFSDHAFEGGGFTMVILLSESHATIHTYPEHQSCFVDFFTCGHSCSSEKFNQVLQKYLLPKKVEKKLFFRDHSIVEKKAS